MPTSPNPPTRMETRQRLLEAAGEVFAERGFRNTTIREICRRAQANLAAVNYHFGDKERLYAAVMKYAHACALKKYPLAQRESEEMPAEKRLHAFISYLLLSVFDKGAPAWLGKLMAREMIEPTRALDALVESIIFPMAQTAARSASSASVCITAMPGRSSNGFFRNSSIRRKILRPWRTISPGFPWAP
jgi:AcrR family transcriptional regulator